MARHMRWGRVIGGERLVQPKRLAKTVGILAIAKTMGIVAIATLGGGAVAAACDLLWSSDQVTYAPDSASPAEVWLVARLQNPDQAEACRESAIALTPIMGTTTLTGPSGATLQTTTNLSSPTTRRGDRQVILNDVARQTLVTEGQVRFPFLRIPVNQFVPAGNYEQLWSVLIEDQQTDEVPIRAEITPVVRLAPSQPTSIPINFGTVGPAVSGARSGLSESANFLYQANVQVQVSLTSDNNGVLQHTDLPQAAGIPYEVRINGQAFNLDGQRQVLAGSRRDGRSNLVQQGQITFTLGPVGNLFAGTYRDVVTMSLSAF